jgi:hypothetical protein
MVPLTLSTPRRIGNTVSILMYWPMLWPMQYDIMPAKLSVPSDYPRSSLMLITDERDDQLRWVQLIHATSDHQIV